jgi:GNAT superfamily N-acetyltransferase
MRPIVASDAGDIVAALRTLSVESLYQRFFTVPPDPTPLVTRHLELVDHRDHEGLVVLDGAAIVATAQWDRSAEDPELAEVAVLVVDAWQRRGLGRALVRAAAGDARRHGIRTLVASVLTENRGGFGLANHQHPAAVLVDGPETLFRFELAS